MSDLSRLLDDVYGPSGAAAPPAPPAPAPAATGLPDWALDSVLDDAFADWVPSAPAAAAPVAPAAAPVAAVAPPVVEPAPVPVRAWCRADDDILPARRGRGSKKAPVADAVPAAAPVIEAFAAEEPAAPRGRFRRRKG